LNKALYGLKQAPRAWYSRLEKYLQQKGFRKGNVDNNIYIKVDQDIIIIIEVYVDEIIFRSDDDKMSQKFSRDMKNEFEISFLGELNFFLGLHICQCDKCIFISYTKYIRETQKKFGMEDCKPISTPMQTSCKLRKEDETKDVDQRLGLMKAVGQVGRFQTTLEETHVMEVKRIFKYFKETKYFGLWYAK
jgi:hypothetical protein